MVGDLSARYDALFKNMQQKADARETRLLREQEMPLTASEFIEKSRDLRTHKRFEEALISSLAAVEADPDNADGWWQTALNRISLDDYRNAIPALRKTVELAPHFAAGWARLGTALLKKEANDEAKNSFEKALSLEAEGLEALEALSKIYSSENNEGQDETEISVLLRIHDLDALSSIQLNRLGILYYRSKNYFEAIHYWKKDFVIYKSPTSLFNIGLAYNQPDVSRDADAVDMWRLAAQRFPDYQSPLKMLADVLPKLVTRAGNARSYGETLLPQDQWHAIYLNPFKLLNPPEDLDLDDFDPKTLQRLKKSLLQEIDLEDGTISWMPGVVVDKSRAMSLCEELSNEEKRRAHWRVYKNKSLCDFLEKGGHEHFLVDEKASPLDTIELLQEDESFLEWLSDPFARQFDILLSKAIEARNMVVLECLLDGRRWVTPSHEDRCFESARRLVNGLLGPLRAALDMAHNVMPTETSVKRILEGSSLVGLLNLLPTHFFQDLQSEPVSLMRDIAIICYNKHSDSDLSKSVLQLTRTFHFKSALMNHQLEEDFKKIEELIREERKDEAKKTLGSEVLEITKGGIRRGERFIAATDLTAIRWGTLVNHRASGNEYEFLLAVTAVDGRQLLFNWKASSNKMEQNREHFGDLITAAMSYLLPHIVKRIEEQLAGGSPVQIGPCKVTSNCIEFKSKGLLFSDTHFVPWERIRTSVGNGDLVVEDLLSHKAKIALPLMEIDNAPVLQILAHIKNQA